MYLESRALPYVDPGACFHDSPLGIQLVRKLHTNISYANYYSIIYIGKPMHSWPILSVDVIP